MRALRFSDDPSGLDRDRIHREIAEQSYRASGRSHETQDAAIDGSWTFGAYDAASGEQLGFARVVTDRATFAWLCDVFVDDALGVRRTMLATADAHGLNARYCVEPLDDPTMYLARKRPATSAG